MLRAGKLNKQILIQTNTQTKDAEGGMADSWATTYTARAALNNVFGSKASRTSHGGDTVEETVEWRVRYRAGITTKMRITYAGKYYSILHLDNINGGNRELLITCSQGLNLGR